MPPCIRRWVEVERPETTCKKKQIIKSRVKIWAWIKLKQLGLRRVQSLFSKARCHFGYYCLSHCHFNLPSCYEAWQERLFNQKSGEHSLDRFPAWIGEGTSQPVDWSMRTLASKAKEQMASVASFEGSKQPTGHMKVDHGKGLFRPPLQGLLG